MLNEALPGEETSLDLTYLEALRAFWRIYWPVQLAEAAGMALLKGNPAAPLLLLVLRGAMLFAVVGRLVARPYKGFYLVGTVPGSEEVTRRLNMRQRLDVWAFLIWRLVVAEVAAFILLGPLNMILGIIGINMAGWLAPAGFVLVSGPILLKVMIGENLGSILLLARRRSAVAKLEGSAVLQR